MAHAHASLASWAGRLGLSGPAPPACRLRPAPPRAGAGHAARTVVPCSCMLLPPALQSRWHAARSRLPCGPLGSQHTLCTRPPAAALCSELQHRHTAGRMCHGQPLTQQQPSILAGGLWVRPALGASCWHHLHPGSRSPPWQPGDDPVSPRLCIEGPQHAPCVNPGLKQHAAHSLRACVGPVAHPHPLLPPPPLLLRRVAAPPHARWRATCAAAHT